MLKESAFVVLLAGSFGPKWGASFVEICPASNLKIILIVSRIEHGLQGIKIQSGLFFPKIKYTET